MASAGASFGIGAGRSPDVGATGWGATRRTAAGCAGAPGTASGATGSGVGAGSGCGGAALETLASTSESAANATAPRAARKRTPGTLKHPAARLILACDSKTVGPPRLASLAIVNVVRYMWDVNGLLSDAGGRQW